MLEQLAALESQVFSLETQLGVLTSALSGDQLADIETANRIVAIGARIQTMITSITTLTSSLPTPPPATL